MSDYTKTDIGAGYNSTQAINSETSKIETAVNSKVDESGGVMSGSLDMNSNRILNLPDASGLQEPVTYNQLINGAPFAAADAKFFDTVTLAASDTTLTVGDVVVIKERANGIFDVVLTSGVTPNAQDIIIGVSDALVSLVLRVGNSLDIKQLGAVAGSDVSSIIDRGLVISNEVIISADYEYNVINLQNYSVLKSLNGSSLTLTTGHTPISSATVQGAGLTGIQIVGIKFIGLGSEASTYRMVSLNESVNPIIRHCKFQSVHGTCLRLNKSEGAYVANVSFDDVTGDAGNPGEGIYALGIIHFHFEKLQCSNIGDHLIYIQGTDDTDFNRVEDGKINDVSAYTTGVNGLTGGAAIVFYNKVKNVQVTNIYTKNCPTGLKLGLKVNYTGLTTHQMVSYSNIINESPTNRGFEITQDASVPTPAVTFTDTGNLVGIVAHGLANGDSVNFATVVTTTGLSTETTYYVISSTADTFQIASTHSGSALALTTNGTGTLSAPRASNISYDDCNTIYSLGAWGMEFTNTDNLSVKNSDNKQGLGGGLSMTTCRHISIDQGDMSRNSNGYGMFINACETGSITGVTANLNFRAGLNINGACDLVYASNLILTPVTGVNDTFITSATATNCVYQNLVIRDYGNVITSTLYGSSAPIVGNWIVGDKVFFTNVAAAGKVGSVCTTAGNPGTWKAFGVVDA